MKRIFIFFKILTKTFLDKFLKFFRNIYARLFFAYRGYYLRKPFLVRNCNFIKINGRGSISQGARIEFYANKEGTNPSLTLGNNVVIMYNCTMLISSNLKIDDNAMIASNVLITTENHGMNPLLGNYIEQDLVSADVKIGKNVRIGEKCVILPGVSIGDNSIIGSGSVVTKNIPANCLACGTPARVIKVFDLSKGIWIKVGEKVDI